MSDEEIKIEDPIIEPSQEELDAIESERLAEIERQAEIKAEKLRIIEAARIQDLVDRYDNLKDHRAAGAALGVSNVDLYFKQEILESDLGVVAEIKMSELEQLDSGIYEASQIIPYSEARIAEYKSIEDIIHVILDHGMNSQEFIDLQSERAAIKLKYPKK